MPEIQLPPLCTYKDLRDPNSGIHIEDLGIYQISIIHRLKKLERAK